jgi:ACS family tartrate transporter-like MFS transporter
LDGVLKGPRPDGLAPARLGDRVVRKVTLRLIPFLALCYFVAYLNRVNLSFGALQMNKALGLSHAAYGFGAGLFFVTYCLCEVPSNLLLHRFGARRWIARIMVTWGLCAGAMAFVHNAASFYLVRLLLGAAEAGFYPGVLFFITLWFPSAHRGRIFGLFIAAIPLSGIIGSPLSGLLLCMNGILGLAGWQWLYLLEALPAILLAPVALLYLQDRPTEARWLACDERTWLVTAMKGERAAVETIGGASLARTLTNPLVLLLAAAYFSNVCLLNGITFFLPQIVHGFGLSVVATGFVVAVPSVLGLIGVIWWGRRSDTRQERFGHVALANIVGGMALLLSVLVHDPLLRMTALSIAFAATLCFVSPFWAIPASFLTGASAAGGIAAISALGASGGFFAPWFVGTLRDVTGTFTVGLGAIGCLAIITGLGFYRIGTRRRRAGAMAEAKAVTAGSER